MKTAEKCDIAVTLRDEIGRASRKMGISIEGDRVEKLVEYAEELLRWNKAYNLVGRRIGAEGLVSLYVDALTPLYVGGLIDENKEVLDIGSGAGLPGLPLYLAIGPFPITLVESQRKKVTFLRHIVRKLDLREVRVFPGRLEEINKQEDSLNAFEICLARAVMDPLRLIKAAFPLLSDGGRTVVFVGKNDAEKIKKASPGLIERGMKLETLKSTQRIVGKEHYLAVVSKTSGRH